MQGQYITSALPVRKKTIQVFNGSDIVLRPLEDKPLLWQTVRSHNAIYCADKEAAIIWCNTFPDYCLRAPLYGDI